MKRAERLHINLIPKFLAEQVANYIHRNQCAILVFDSLEHIAIGTWLEHPLNPPDEDCPYEVQSAIGGCRGSGGVPREDSFVIARSPSLGRTTKQSRELGEGKCDEIASLRSQ